MLWLSLVLVLFAAGMNDNSITRNGPITIMPLPFATTKSIELATIPPVEDGHCLTVNYVVHHVDIGSGHETRHYFVWLSENDRFVISHLERSRSVYVWMGTVVNMTLHAEVEGPTEQIVQHYETPCHYLDPSMPRET